jgi:hypothetical protein
MRVFNLALLSFVITMRRIVQTDKHHIKEARCHQLSSDSTSESLVSGEARSLSSDGRSVFLHACRS